ncbi:TldD/PmbA family protein [Alkalibacillus aidingensis]|uniref:TldD/PmbA family protein n=1 Tax=Alkalibacillus aidingensis TaxID=2747607 RepID=UPI001660E34B|nr:metallopeptidase TldD-related protein [Alkalibacillus aidingensis]
MNIQDFKQQLFERGENQGFNDMELYYEKSDSFNCKIDLGEVDQFTTAEEIGVSFRGVYKGKMGYAYTEKLDESSIEFLVENARENALILEEEDQEEIYQGDSEYKDVNFLSEDLQQVSNEEKINFMKEFDRHIYKIDERVTGTGFFQLMSNNIEKAMYNTKGLALEDQNNFIAFGVMVIVKENDLTKSGMHFKHVQDWASLDPEEEAKKAVEEAISYLNPMEVESNDYPVLLRHDAASSLLATFLSIFSAETAQKGMSKLKDKVGKKIAGNNVTFVDEPFRQDAMKSRTFDAEGVASKELTVVENGKLNTLFHNRKTAKKDGVESTGHAYKESYKGSLTVSPSNFYLVPGEPSYDDIVSSLKEGVVVTSLSGLHSGVNQISGDFSVAANGYYVKDGEVQAATNLMTIAGNFFDLLNHVESVGSDLEFSPFSGVGAPSFLVEGLSVTFE